MNRRVFLGCLAGAAAVQALPSEVWPFRKIFLPPVVTNPYIDPEYAARLVGTYEFQVELGQTCWLYGQAGYHLRPSVMRIWTNVLALRGEW